MFTIRLNAPFNRITYVYGYSEIWFEVNIPAPGEPRTTDLMGYYDHFVRLCTWLNSLTYYVACR
ncbi:hypothetical protein HQ584_02350 [Patescibacteria group bacterium]|nr:hypothetical protein [Patescibacteria group bacterium]